MSFQNNSDKKKLKYSKSSEIFLTSPSLLSSILRYFAINSPQIANLFRASNIKETYKVKNLTILSF